MHNPSNTLQQEIFKWRKYDIIWYIDNFVKKCRQFVEGNYHWELFLSNLIPRNAGADHQLNLVKHTYGFMALPIYLVCDIQNSICPMPVFSNIGLLWSVDFNVQQ